MLTNYNGQAITYDNIGNPTKWGNTTYTWDAGRRLMTLNKSGVNASFTYSIDGYRTKKTVNGVTTEYYLDGDRIAGLKKGSDELVFMYDENGLVIGFYYNGIPYIYVKNLQGDVIGIVDKNYDMVVTYSYDAWGKPLSVGGELADTLGKLNPFRYRSYVYDEETGLYYVCSRYYNPEVGRWINEDILIDKSTIMGTNLYMYCQCNPVNMIDLKGELPFFVVTAITGAVVGAVVGGVIAYENGNNVWSGIGIGAAAGALVGTGIGMAAGATLAGSITATTSSVMAGGSAVITTTSTGGVSAGVACVSSNIQKAGNQVAASVANITQKTTNTVTYSQGKAFVPGKIGLQTGVNPNTLISTKNLATLDSRRMFSAIRYGGDKAVIVGRTGVIYDGHHRVAYAIKTGKAIDVYVNPYK